MINDRQSKLCREPDWNGFLNSIDVNSDKLIDYNEVTKSCSNQLHETNSHSKNIQILNKNLLIPLVQVCC